MSTIPDFADFREGKSIRAKLSGKAKLRTKSAQRSRWFRQKRKWRKKYNLYLRSDEWKEKREERLKLCNGMCEFCHVAPAAHVHHVTYARVFKERIEDLRGICLDCHGKEHGRKFKSFKKPEVRGTEEADFDDEVNNREVDQ